MSYSAPGVLPERPGAMGWTSWNGLLPVPCTSTVKVPSTKYEHREVLVGPSLRFRLQTQCPVGVRGTGYGVQPSAARLRKGLDKGDEVVDLGFGEHGIEFGGHDIVEA